MRRRSKIALLAGALAAGYAGVAAAELTYTVEAGAGHTDNVTRVEEDETSESIASAGLTLEWQEQRPRLRADVSADADYVHYLDDTYDGEIVGGLDGTLDFTVVPDRLRWLVQDSFGQQASDPFSPVTPETRENVNYFSTGPIAEFLLGRQLATLFGTYSLTEHERNPFDSERVVAGASIGRRTPGGSGFALNAVTEQVAFKEEANTDFDRESLYLTYSIEGARTEISAEAGYTWLELEDGTESGDPRVRVEVTRELSSASLLSLTAGTQLTDSSEALRAGLSAGGAAGGGSVSSAADPFQNRFASLVWEFARRRTSFSLGADWSDDTYETQTGFDRTRITYEAAIGREVSSRLSLSLAANLVDEEFDASGQSAETRQADFNVNWNLGPTMGLRLSLMRSDRESDGGLGNYTENRVFLSLVYRSGIGRRRGSAAP